MSENVPSYGGIVRPKACPFCGFSMTEVVERKDNRRYVQCG
jgi:hypothetical protein